MNRVTIKSIANDLGISHMTVSRALSNSPNVQKETREAVQKRARELGYVRNAAAMVMRGDAPKIVGLLLPNIVNEFYARFANDMATACESHSLQLIIHLTNDDVANQQQALDRLQEVQASSVVMVPAPNRTDGDTPNTGSMRTIELIRQSSNAPDTPAILVDDDPAIRAATDHLARAGHTHIAYIGATRDLSSGRRRLEAFVQGTTEAGLTIPPEMIHTGAPSFAMGRDKANMILEENRATAILCGGFEISNGALSAVIDGTRNIDRKIAFVGYGDPSFYAWIENGISTVQVPVTELANHAVDLITTQDSEASVASAFPAKFIAR
ncbi:LacI family DNA-binding transcriptional regulator [Amaricoccus tamworthensis]|uniref:LacI family DNA-binding transcriptional regulator n=1 Tax=Amaricoccus tamworthensis TaxID=57002 RepID=UPI003C7C790F